MPAPLLAPWVVPGVLTLIALAVSATLVVLTHRKRLAELAGVPDLEDLEPAPDPAAVEPVEPRRTAPEAAPEVEALQRQVESLTRTLSASSARVARSSALRRRCSSRASACCRATKPVTKTKPVKPQYSSACINASPQDSSTQRW